jgi:hypothetical protein
MSESEAAQHPPSPHSRAKIDEMRARLYQRGTNPPQRTEAKLTDTPEAVPDAWADVQHMQPAPPAEAPPSSPVAPVAARRQRSSVRRRARRIIVSLGVLFFVGALSISTIVMLFGNNSISADNIAVSVNGPFTVGGGETVNIQVGVTNANAVPISAATLIINFPEGTRRPGDNSVLFVERLSLETIRAGETVNVPVSAVIFGEENSNQQIDVSIEYRVEGSNATFFREAEPYEFKISSAPVVLEAAGNLQVSSGQETDIRLIVSSNAQAPIQDIIVTADYPNAFDYTLAEPAPVRGQNTWRIDELAPGETSTINIRGIFTGSESDELAMHFLVGAPTADDPTRIASVFNAISTQVAIERPFLDIEMEINGETESTAVIEPGRGVNGQIRITNTLSDIIYDTEIDLVLGGNALSDETVDQTDGFYDSLTNTISWTPATNNRLLEIEPGESVVLSFNFVPDESVRQTPVVTLSAAVESRRVRESRVPERLAGSIERMVQVASIPTMLSEARRTSGPIPPEINQVTNYTISLLAETASNNLNNVVVTTVLPPYVTYADDTSGAGSVSYNEATRTVTWQVGEIEVGQPAVGSFAVSFRPTVAQVDRIPVLIEEQRLRAEDAFTGSVVRATQRGVTTEMSTELGFAPDNGRVVE